jgi:hypothetical protein
MVGKANKSPPTSAVADRTNPRFFTQIYAEMIRRLVRRGGFFVLWIKFFAALRLCESKKECFNPQPLIDMPIALSQIKDMSD